MSACSLPDNALRRKGAASGMARRAFAPAQAEQRSACGGRGAAGDALTWRARAAPRGGCLWGFQPGASGCAKRSHACGHIGTMQTGAARVDSALLAQPAHWVLARRAALRAVRAVRATVRAAVRAVRACAREWRALREIALDACGGERESAGVALQRAKLGNNVSMDDLLVVV